VNTLDQGTSSPYVVLYQFLRNMATRSTRAYPPVRLLGVKHHYIMPFCVAERCLCGLFITSMLPNQCSQNHQLKSTRLLKQDLRLVHDLREPFAGPDVGCCFTLFFFFFLCFSTTGPDSSSNFLPILLFHTLRSAVFASPFGKVLRLKYSPPYSSNLDRQNKLDVSVYV